MDDATIEARLQRPTFRALLENIHILALPLGAVERILQQTRHAGECYVRKPRLEAYCKNAEYWGYSDSQKLRGVAVCKQTRTKARPEEWFLHVFRFDEEGLETVLPGGYMNGLMKVRTFFAHFGVDDGYESLSLAKDLYARPLIDGGHCERAEYGNSLAFEYLGLPELQQERPTKPDVQALLAKAAAFTRIDKSILAVQRISRRSSSTGRSGRHSISSSTCLT